MEKRGPKPKPELARYDAAGVERAIYVVEIADAVKVGKTESPSSRLRALHNTHRRTGEVLGRFRIFPCDGHAMDLFNLECACIHSLMGVATALPGRREYFAGITFDAAVQAVARVVASPSLPL